jgi:predicted aspartyl protease
VAERGHSFTGSSDGRLRELSFDCFIAPAFDPKTTATDKQPSHQKFRAIFDTGATNCVITQKIVDALGLKPISMAVAETANGKVTCEVYLVNIRLPNGVGFTHWRVTKQDLPSKTEVLIGMDVIGNGDFAVTHKDKKTVFSFRIPSIARIDFVKEHENASKGTPVVAAPIVGRNSPCPCGSGRKYKQCCGKGKH